MRREVTNVFLVRNKEVCLGMKKRGFGMGNWNGTGGKIESGESAEDGAKREAREEFGVELVDIKNVGETLFVFKDGLEIHCHIFICDKWNGEIVESEEMAPKWFDINKLPLANMWSTDVSWLPMILNGKKIKGTYYFNDDAKSLERYELGEVN
jgi:8-oxo-dGTP pyrophosphatase MutT (NUDIX family)